MTTQHPDTPETGITPGGTSGAFRDVLSKDHARRGKPPLHFVDMTPEQRIEKAAELGLPKFRVKQLANHYFGHFDVNAAEFTDFPAAKRSEAAPAPSGGRRHHHQDLVEAVRRLPHRIGAYAIPDPHHAVHLLAGRLRHGLPVLRHRQAWPDP